MTTALLASFPEVDRSTQAEFRSPKSLARAVGSLNPAQQEALGAQASTRANQVKLELASSETLWAICSHQQEYPQSLRDLAEPPPVIYGAGKQDRFVALAAAKVVTCIGARRASSYGRDIAFSFGSGLSKAGTTVVTGMALGIDGAAARGALQNQGNTIAVLPSGPDNATPPSHRHLYEQIVADGAVISEIPPGFPQASPAHKLRPRIIAALGQVAVLVEATGNSFANQVIKEAETLDRHIAAVPGPVTSPLSAAPNELILEHRAQMVADLTDLTQLGNAPAGAPIRTFTFFCEDSDRNSGWNNHTFVLQRAFAGCGTDAADALHNAAAASDKEFEAYLEVATDFDETAPFSDNLVAICDEDRIPLQMTNGMAPKGKPDPPWGTRVVITYPHDG